MGLRLAAVRAVGSLGQLAAPADCPLKMAFQFGERGDLDGGGGGTCGMPARCPAMADDATVKAAPSTRDPSDFASHADWKTMS